MIHIGTQKTLKTLCGKPVARRWWVEDTHVEYGALTTFGGVPVLGISRTVEPEGADCKDCLRKKARR